MHLTLTITANGTDNLHSYLNAYIHIHSSFHSELANIENTYSLHVEVYRPRIHPDKKNDSQNIYLYHYYITSTLNIFVASSMRNIISNVLSYRQVPDGSTVLCVFVCAFAPSTHHFHKCTIALTNRLSALE